MPRQRPARQTGTRREGYRGDAGTREASVVLLATTLWLGPGAGGSSHTPKRMKRQRPGLAFAPLEGVSWLYVGSILALRKPLEGGQMSINR